MAEYLAGETEHWDSVVCIIGCVLVLFSQGFRGSGKGAFLESWTSHIKSKMRVISLSVQFCVQRR